MTGKVCKNKPIREMSLAESTEHFEKIKRGLSATTAVKERKTKLELLLDGDNGSGWFQRSFRRSSIVADLAGAKISL
jgi:hypothetical protein